MSQAVLTMPAGAPVESDAEFQRQDLGFPSRCDEARQFQRFAYQTRVEAIVHPLHESQGPPAQCDMMTRDISRGGINLVHSEQLMPRQRIDIELDGLSRRVEVMWCRRIANRCYSAGCRFVARPITPGELTREIGR